MDGGEAVQRRWRHGLTLETGPIVALIKNFASSAHPSQWMPRVESALDCDVLRPLPTVLPNIELSWRTKVNRYRLESESVWLDTPTRAGGSSGEHRSSLLWGCCCLIVTVHTGSLFTITLGGKSMRRLIVAALLVASFLTVDAWAQNIDWGQKSRSLDIGMSEDVVMKTLGHSPNSVTVAVCSGPYGSPTGPRTCKIHDYGNMKNGLIVRFQNDEGKWLSYSWSVSPR